MGPRAAALCRSWAGPTQRRTVLTNTGHSAFNTPQGVPREGCLTQCWCAEGHTVSLVKAGGSPDSPSCLSPPLLPEEGETPTWSPDLNLKHPDPGHPAVLAPRGREATGGPGAKGASVPVLVQGAVEPTQEQTEGAGAGRGREGQGGALPPRLPPPLLGIFCLGAILCFLEQTHCYSCTYQVEPGQRGGRRRRKSRQGLRGRRDLWGLLRMRHDGWDSWLDPPRPARHTSV